MVSGRFIFLLIADHNVMRLDRITLFPYCPLAGRYLLPTVRMQVFGILAMPETIRFHHLYKRTRKCCRLSADHTSAPSGRALLRQVEKIRTKVFPKFHQPTDRGVCENSCVCTGSCVSHLRCSSREATATASKQHVYADYPMETTSTGTMYRMGVEIS